VLGVRQWIAKIPKQRKDAELLKNGEVKGVTWHFYRSELTGKIGGSGPLLKQLTGHGIGYVIHY
jgi:hypothetical protein